MTGWSFLVSRRWAGYLALTIVFAIVCAGLANWQLDRRSQAQAEIARVDNNYDAPPQQIGEVLPTLGAFDESQKWTQLQLSGTYLPEDQLLVRNRPLGGSPGFAVLTPLRLDDGSIFIVDRGWLPTGSLQDAPDVVPAAPSGTVTVVVRIKSGEPEIPGRGAEPGQIATVHLPDIAQRVGGDVYTGAYGLMISESPAPAERPTAQPKPLRDEGPHLSYAFQWYVFALMAFIGLAWAARQEYRTVNADDPAERERAAERARRRAAKAKNDAQIEDELLDAGR